jgi:hypothetical protein
VFLGLPAPDPDPLARGISLSKYSKKNLDFYCFAKSFYFLSLKMMYKYLKKVIYRKTVMKMEGSGYESGSIS